MTTLAHWKGRIEYKAHKIDSHSCLLQKITKYPKICPWLKFL
jgi:hypothetical protein